MKNFFKTIFFFKIVTRHVFENKKGFTLVEAFFAVTIMMFAIVGPLTLIHESLRAAHDARDHAIASYLALEGVEIVRNIRDNQALSNPGHHDWIDWLGDMRACDGALCYASIDDAGPPQVSLCGGTCPPVRLSSIGYGYDGAYEASPFTRWFVVDTDWINEGEGISQPHATVTVSVSWHGTQPRIVRYEYHIYNW